MLGEEFLVLSRSVDFGLEGLMSNGIGTLDYESIENSHLNRSTLN